MKFMSLLLALATSSTAIPALAYEDCEVILESVGRLEGVVLDDGQIANVEAEATTAEGQKLKINIEKGVCKAQVSNSQNPTTKFKFVESKRYSQGSGFRATGYLIYAGFLGDAVSTDLALSQPGTREANGLMANRAVRWGSHIVLPAVINIGTSHVHRAGHKKMALITRILIGGAYTALTIHNVGVYKEAQRLNR